MSIAIRELDLPALPIVTASVPDTNSINPELLSLIHTEINTAAMESVEKSQRYADAVMRDVFKRMEEKLAHIEAPKPQVMAIEIGGEIKRLKTPASPYLGELIVRAKLRKNVLLKGPKGCGKTTLVGQLAEALALPYSHLCFTAGASESWLLGRHTANGFIPAAFIERYKNGGVFLADEFDAADANLALLMNTALDNGHLYNPMTGETLTRHPDFIFIAACNTFGKGADEVYTGRNRLDGATLDRFRTVIIDYTPELEKRLCPNKLIYKRLVAARRKLNSLSSIEGISTRVFRDSFDEFQAGLPWESIVLAFTASWPDGLADQCGLLAPLVEAEEKPEAAEVPAMAAESVPF